MIIRIGAYCVSNYTLDTRHRDTGGADAGSRKHGFGIHIQEPFKIDGIVVSSTYIRELIKDGKLEECHRFMGRMYAIGGEVVVGNKLGRTIGFQRQTL